MKYDLIIAVDTEKVSSETILSILSQLNDSLVNCQIKKWNNKVR
jgi:hypothetical protein